MIKTTYWFCGVISCAAFQGKNGCTDITKISSIMFSPGDEAEHDETEQHGG